MRERDFIPGPDYRVFHVERYTRCYKGGSAGKPPKAPPPPSPQTASQAVRQSDIERRRRAARGFESTILTSGMGVTQLPDNINSPLLRRLFGA